MIESIKSLPMPGQAKIVSVTTAKASMEPISRPTTVISGIKIVFMTWTPTMRRSVRPLARANLMKSSGSVSRTPVRVRRMTSDSLNSDRLIAGRIRWARPSRVNRLERMPRKEPSSPRPVEGSQPSQTEKIMISIMPCQKLGSEKPRMEPVMMVSSVTVFGFRPARRPSGMPRPRAKTRPTKVSSSVAGRRCRMRLMDGWLKTKERPRSPCTAFHRKVPNWCHSG